MMPECPHPEVLWWAAKLAWVSPLAAYAVLQKTDF